VNSTIDRRILLRWRRLSVAFMILGYPRVRLQNKVESNARENPKEQGVLLACIMPYSSPKEQEEEQLLLCHIKHHPRCFAFLPQRWKASLEFTRKAVVCNRQAAADVETSLLAACSVRVNRFKDLPSRLSTDPSFLFELEILDRQVSFQYLPASLRNNVELCKEAI